MGHATMVPSSLIAWVRQQKNALVMPLGAGRAVSEQGSPLLRGRQQLGVVSCCFASDERGSVILPRCEPLPSGVGIVSPRRSARADLCPADLVRGTEMRPASSCLSHRFGLPARPSFCVWLPRLQDETALVGFGGAGRLGDGGGRESKKCQNGQAGRHVHIGGVVCCSRLSNQESQGSLALAVRSVSRWLEWLQFPIKSHVSLARARTGKRWRDASWGLVGRPARVPLCGVHYLIAQGADHRSRARELWLSTFPSCTNARPTLVRGPGALLPPPDQI